MALKFSLKFTQYFLKQWEEFNQKEKNFVQSKLELIKKNPFRYPKHEGYTFVFKVKLSIDNKFSRLMYAVFMPDSEHITILGLFDRSANYKDFERIFKDLRK